MLFGPKEVKPGACGDAIEFGDDVGDNTTTFQCDLPVGHDGRHQERGTMRRYIFASDSEGDPAGGACLGFRRQPYLLTWKTEDLEQKE